MVELAVLMIIFWAIGVLIGIAIGKIIDKRK